MSEPTAFTPANGGSLPVNDYVPLKPPQSQSQSDNSFAEQTRLHIDDIVGKCATELQMEIQSLHKLLEEFEQTSLTSAAHTRAALTSYVETIKYGHALTEQIRNRLDVMRQAQEQLGNN